ncbi:MAG: cysteine synthase A [Oscillospiraceae bacterium]|nr:cysteine synthase A [Candidatus Limimonas coprohippi]MCQ2488834.1 cysteine synthase A [Clostridia bacterium]
MKIYSSVIELIGGTPLFKPENYMRAHGCCANIFVKLEYLNPAGSIKDRAALSMIEDAEKSGRLLPGGTIIEPTSGNTGIALAAISASRGYKAVIVMPDSMSVERQQLMRAYGALVVLTPGAEGMAGAIKRAEEIQKDTEGSIIVGQFVNPANVLAHINTTGPEIWEDTDGKIDILVAGVGTGGTITGLGKYLKEKNPSIKIVAVEPETSPLLSKGFAGKHGLQGIGANFVPEILNKDIIDEIITVSDEDAFETGREMASREGILVGITSGAALYAAKTLSKRSENAGKNIVAILPDTGDRYLTTAMFNE